MQKKKNIDDLFSEGFKDHKVTPPPHVWDKIQTRLKEEKRERKVVPLWLRLGGVAALLALMLSVGNWFFTSDIYNSPSITHENPQPKNNLDPSKTRSVVSDTEQSNSTAETEIAAEAEISGGKNSAGNDGSESTSLKANSTETQKTTEAIHRDNPSQLATAPEKNDGSAKPVSPFSSEEVISEDNKRIENPLQKNKGEMAVETPANQDSEANGETTKKKSILDAIAEQDEQEKLKEIEKEKQTLPRWEVSPNVAPVYYSSLKGGSSIDPSLSENPQKGDFNISYGVQVSYALNDRLKIRAGINNVDLSYSTSDILVGTGPATMGLRSVDYGQSKTVVTAVSRSESSASPNGHFENIVLKTSAGDARLIQSINYVEVPVELKYSVINSRLGINLIGGVSTLILGNDEISVKADNFSSVLGTANNLSQVSFSTNVGVGVDYKLSKKFTFNIEPMFKYQLNPYTDSSVDFKPYYLGVYSGLSFKF